MCYSMVARVYMLRLHKPKSPRVGALLGVAPWWLCTRRCIGRTKG